MFTRAELDRHITKSGKNIAGVSHYGLPTGLKKPKIYLEDEYLHDIETNFDAQWL